MLVGTAKASCTKPPLVSWGATTTRLRPCAAYAASVYSVANGAKRTQCSVVRARREGAGGAVAGREALDGQRVGNGGPGAVSPCAFLPGCHQRASRYCRRRTALRAASRRSCRVSCSMWSWPVALRDPGALDGGRGGSVVHAGSARSGGRCTWRYGGDFPLRAVVGWLAPPWANMVVSRAAAFSRVEINCDRVVVWRAALDAR